MIEGERTTITAKVRISTALRNDNASVGALRKIDGVKDAHLDYNIGQIIVELQGKDAKTLDNILFLQIRKLKSIRSTSPVILD